MMTHCVRASVCICESVCACALSGYVYVFLDGYYSTLQGLLDWFELD